MPVRPARKSTLMHNENEGALPKLGCKICTRPEYIHMHQAENRGTSPWDTHTCVDHQDSSVSYFAMCATWHTAVAVCKET